MPQPYLVPVRPTFSRIAHKRGVSASTSTSIVLPLIMRFAIAFPLIGSFHRVNLAAMLDPKLELFKSRFYFGRRNNRFVMGWPLFPVLAFFTSPRLRGEVKGAAS